MLKGDIYCLCINFIMFGNVFFLNIKVIELNNKIVFYRINRISNIDN